MLKKLFLFFTALTLSVGLWADGSVFTYTAEEMLSEDKLNEWLGEGNFTHDFDAPNGTITCTEEVTELPEEVFRNSYELLSFELPTSVTAIGVDAFSNCAQLQSITMPNVTEIGNYAFNGCQSLQSVTMPNVTEIGNNVFMDCPSLQSITLPASVTTIGQGAFQDCESLQSITIPAGVTTIGEEAFMDCSALQSVTFEGTSCTIGEDAFAGVGSDTPAALNLPAGWTGSTPVNNSTPWYGGYFNYTAPVPEPQVSDQFTDATSGLKFEVTSLDPKTVKVIANGYTGTYTVPASVTYLAESFNVTTIGEGAFRDGALESIILPESVMTIEADAFNTCEVLVEIDLSNVTEIGEGAFNDCGQLQSVNMPNVTTIGNAAFSGCIVLESITLPNVTTIGENAFMACGNLQSLTIPANVTEIGKGAFLDCSALQSVTFLGTSCTIGEDAFAGVGSDAPAALNLPDNWTGSKPADSETPWYGGYFVMDEPYYTRSVTNGNWGTICLPWASVKLEGGLFYDVLGTKDPAQGVALAELGESDQLTAGKPYVFKASSNQIKVTYSPATAVEEEVPGNNIIGSFDGCNVPQDKYIIVNNLLYKTADATSTIAANRAYFDVDAMGVYTPAQAAGRRVVFMGGKTTPTGDEQVTGNSEQVTGKFLYKGQFVIVKEGKMYNALGM